VGGPVHFWTLEDVGLVSGWDPDSDPGLFGSGRSHQLYEMFARLKARGAAVSLGCRVPREARLVVTTLRELTRFRGKLLAERGMASRAGALSGQERTPHQRRRTPLRPTTLIRPVRGHADSQLCHRRVYAALGPPPTSKGDGDARPEAPRHN
jgi:hypothetical protein